jgi:hypothetical protein
MDFHRELLKLIEQDSYKGEHEAPTPESGAPLFDLTKNGIYPEDFYQGKDHQYVYSDEDKSVLTTILNFHKKPNKTIKIYRAIPSGLKATIEIGNWVSITRSYAKEHGESNLKNDYRIISKIVYARDIFTDGDSLSEWGYYPQPRIQRSEKEEIERRIRVKEKFIQMFQRALKGEKVIGINKIQGDPYLNTNDGILDEIKKLQDQITQIKSGLEK